MALSSRCIYDTKGDAVNLLFFLIPFPRLCGYGIPPYIGDIKAPPEPNPSAPQPLKLYSTIVSSFCHVGRRSLTPGHRRGQLPTLYQMSDNAEGHDDEHVRLVVLGIALQASPSELPSITQ